MSWNNNSGFLKVQIFNLSWPVIYDTIPGHFLTIFPLGNHMQSLCPPNKPFGILSLCAILFPQLWLPHSSFSYGWTLSGHSSYIVLWMKALFNLLVSSPGGRGNYLPCVPTTPGMCSVSNLPQFIMIKCVFGFLSHYPVNSLEAEAVLFQYPLCFLVLPLWALLLQYMKHDPLAETHHSDHII